MTPDAASAADARRLRDLARMRLLATGLLVLMAAVFVLASLGAPRWPALAYLRAFAEAGVVGACADWFAVTALFRRPLGLPIPHTGIIPRNKDRIGAALGAFIAENFLTEAVLEDKLRQLEVARWGGAWLSRPQNARRLARRITAVVPEVLASAPPGAIGQLAAAMGLAAARATPAAPLAASVLGGLWSEGRAQALVEAAVEALAGYVARHEETIREKVAEQSPRWFPRWVDNMLADKVSDGLIRTIQDMRDPAHPWRAELREAVEGFIARLRSDPELQARVERLKLRLLDDPRVRAQGAELWAGLEARIAAEFAGDGLRLAAHVQRAVQAVGEWLAADAAAQQQLNALGRSLAIGVLAPRRHDIGRFVAEVVSGWDTQSVVDKLELQVGRDLQYIRINGALVGGVVGLAVFTAARALGWA